MESEAGMAKPLVRIQLERPDQLFSWIQEFPDSLERGLKILATRQETGWGDAIDLLGMDGAGRFVLMETKIGPDNRILERLLDHYDWFLSHLHLFQRLFAAERPGPGLTPRGILIGPGFHPAMARRIRYLGNLPLDLVEYRVYLQEGTRLTAMERVASNWRTSEPDEVPIREGTAELTEEEREEFYRFERERTSKESPTATRSFGAAPVKGIQSGPRPFRVESIPGRNQR